MLVVRRPYAAIATPLHSNNIPGVMLYLVGLGPRSLHEDLASPKIDRGRHDIAGGEVQ